MYESAPSCTSDACCVNSILARSTSVLDGAGLPHPFGSGPGYENVSKFFFWAMAAVDFASPPDGPQARWMCNGDFAAYLVEQYNLGADDYYQ
mgnify:CR=1 FL=1